MKVQNMYYLGAIPSYATAAIPGRLIYEYPSSNRNQLENIAVRTNGQLLLTSSSEPCISSIDPFQTSPVPVRIHCFEETNGTTGIAEIGSDVFAVNTGKMNGLAGVPGTWSIWTLAFHSGGPILNVTRLARISAAQALNGMTNIPGEDAVVVADSGFGALWKVNTRSGAYGVLDRDPHFLPNDTVPIGINGVHAVPGGLFVSNTANATFGGLRTNWTGTDNKVPFRVLAGPSPGNAFDDFAISPKQNRAYVTEHPSRLISIDLVNGEEKVIASGENTSFPLRNPTSAAFGNDGCTLYVVTYGSMGTGNFSGQIIEFNVCAS